MLPSPTSRPLQETLTAWSELLSPYTVRINRTIASWLNQQEAHQLSSSCRYALTTGGRRVRPAIVYMIADALSSDSVVDQVALAIELFHTASLIADDLPCMDDEEQRRNRPSLHRVHGELMALLTSYALIAEGYRCFAKNSQQLHQAGPLLAQRADAICTIALEIAAKNTGIEGATAGQFLDLCHPSADREQLRKVVELKTVSLFEIAFVSGWLYGGGEVDRLATVRRAAYHYGMAFQIADDIRDAPRDRLQIGGINYLISCGADQTLADSCEAIENYRAALAELEIATPPLLALGDLLRLLP